MKKKSANISILSANFNNAKFLIDFFESIINSTVLPEEVIIVDDCSTDNSVQIITEYQKKIENLSLVKLKSNMGFANALNEGITKVRNKYILRVDPDDILDKRRIEKQWNFALKNPEVDVIGSNVYYFIDSTTKVIGKSNFPQNSKEIIERYKNGYHGLVHGSILIKSEILQKNRYNQSQVPAEEYDLFSRILKQKHIAQNLYNSLTYVRIHNSSASHNYPISTFKKIREQQRLYWNKENSNFNFYRKYLMINLYRRSLTTNKVAKLFYKLLASLLAPNLIINRLKKQ